MSEMCSILLELKSRCSDEVQLKLVEVQFKVHCRVLVNFLIRLLAKLNVFLIGLYCARMRGHGSSSVRRFSERSMYVKDGICADMSRALGSTDVMRL